MDDLLFSRTFTLVGGMLLITSLAARKNRIFETRREVRISTLGIFAFLFAIMIFKDTFARNLILVGGFSVMVGRSLGPAIRIINRHYKLRKYLAGRGIYIKWDKQVDKELQNDFEAHIAENPHLQNKYSVVSQAVLATAFAVLSMAGIVFFTNINVSFLEAYLLSSLFILMFMVILNALIFHSPFISMASSYAGVLLFTLYLLYDFNRLEKMA